MKEQAALWVRRPAMLPLIYVAVAAVVPVVVFSNATRSTNWLGASATRATLVMWMICPFVVSVAWWLQSKRTGWQKFWGNYLRLISDILLASGVAALAHLQATFTPIEYGFQLMQLFIMNALLAYMLAVVVGDILRIVEDAPLLRREVRRGR